MHRTDRRKQSHGDGSAVSRFPGAELTSLPVLLAGAVLIVNDHLLKGLWPGFVTGKLSDVAGLFLSPFLLCALVRWGVWAFAYPLRGLLRPQDRRGGAPLFSFRLYQACALATAAGFTAIKVLPAARSFYTDILSSIGFGPASVAPDLSDLAALLVLPLGSLHACHLERRADGDQRETPWRPRRFARCAVAAAMCLACLATSKMSRNADLTGRGAAFGGTVTVYARGVDQNGLGQLEVPFTLTNSSGTTYTIKATGVSLAVAGVTAAGDSIENATAHARVAKELRLPSQSKVKGVFLLSVYPDLDERLEAATSAVLTLQLEIPAIGQKTPIRVVMTPGNVLHVRGSAADPLRPTQVPAREADWRVWADDVREKWPAALETELSVQNYGPNTLVLRADTAKLNVFDVTVTGGAFDLPTLYNLRAGLDDRGSEDGALKLTQVEIPPHSTLRDNLQFVAPASIGPRLSTAKQAVLDLVIEIKDTGETLPVTIIMKP